MAQETNLSQLLDLAVDKLPALRKRVMKTRLRNIRYRNQVLDQLQLDLSEDSRVAEMGLAATLADGQFTSTSKIQLDPDRLEQFLKIILEYLPQILDLIFKLFGALVLVLLFPSFASAQCPGGNCGTWQPSRVYYQAPQPVYQEVRYVQPQVHSGPLYTQPTGPLYTSVVRQPAPQVHSAIGPRSYTAKVYQSSSFNSNGSGQTLADHLAFEHGTDATGMSAAEQDAAHIAAHRSQGYSRSSYQRPRFRPFRR